ncbi:DUF2391 family protein [Halosimplex halophilum]|uniref:DUF2391 family protein n=1 Tax=Halosimplex halophilum TaxID=2559572 RepID=UPI00107FB858|nr:DUF2391 family protein [Halosimplex halophilum]
MTDRDGAAGDDPDRDPDPDIDDVLDDLEELEELVDRPEERERVREAMRTARRANRPRVVGRIHDAFDLRDAGEAVVGAFLFGIPMVVEGGTQEIGVAIADSPVAVALTAALGFLVVLGILHAARFEAVEADLIAGVVPRRLVGILGISAGMAVGLMTLWRRVDWSQPDVAAAQCLVTAVVMAVGASLGDVLPE